MPASADAVVRGGRLLTANISATVPAWRDATGEDPKRGARVRARNAPSELAVLDALEGVAKARGVSMPKRAGLAVGPPASGSSSPARRALDAELRADGLNLTRGELALEAQACPRSVIPMARSVRRGMRPLAGGGDYTVFATRRRAGSVRDGPRRSSHSLRRQLVAAIDLNFHAFAAASRRCLLILICCRGAVWR